MQLNFVNWISILCIFISIVHCKDKTDYSPQYDNSDDYEINNYNDNIDTLEDSNRVFFHFDYRRSNNKEKGNTNTYTSARIASTLSQKNKQNKPNVKNEAPAKKITTTTKPKHNKQYGAADKTIDNKQVKANSDKKDPVKTSVTMRITTQKQSNKTTTNKQEKTNISNIPKHHKKTTTVKPDKYKIHNKNSKHHKSSKTSEQPVQPVHNKTSKLIHNNASNKKPTNKIDVDNEFNRRKKYQINKYNSDNFEFDSYFKEDDQDQTYLSSKNENKEIQEDSDDSFIKTLRKKYKKQKQRPYKHYRRQPNWRRQSNKVEKQKRKLIKKYRKMQKQMAKKKMHQQEYHNKINNMHRRNQWINNNKRNKSKNAKSQKRCNNSVIVQKLQEQSIKAMLMQMDLISFGNSSSTKKGMNKTITTSTTKSRNNTETSYDAVQYIEICEDDLPASSKAQKITTPPSFKKLPTHHNKEYADDDPEKYFIMPTTADSQQIIKKYLQNNSADVECIMLIAVDGVTIDCIKEFDSSSPSKILYCTINDTDHQSIDYCVKLDKNVTENEIREMMGQKRPQHKKLINEKPNTNNVTETLNNNEEITEFEDDEIEDEEEDVDNDKKNHKRKQSYNRKHNRLNRDDDEN